MYQLTRQIKVSTSLDDQTDLTVLIVLITVEVTVGTVRSVKEEEPSASQEQ